MELNVIQRLEAVAALQAIDSRLDRIRSIRGGLPEEVADLEDEIEGIRTRLERLEGEVGRYQRDISERTIAIQEFKDLIAKYESQLNEVRNQREYESLNKEIEYAQLEIQANDRRINMAKDQIGERSVKVEETAKHLNERSTDLIEKNKELDLLIEETKVEEDQLIIQSDKAQAQIEARLLKAYTRIRKNMRNGLAVVTMDRGACGGCFAIIPPQRQCEIRQKKRIIVCENCGRILVDVSFFPDRVEVAEPEALAM